VVKLCHFRNAIPAGKALKGSMNSTSSRALASLALALLLFGCGGGGTESGSPEEIFISPDEVVVTGPSGSCAVGEGPTVHLYGGVPPYRLSNSYPSAMALDKTEVEDSGDGFTLHFTNGLCVDGMPITVEDRLGNLATLIVTNQAGTD
jgi:hypothetical protein